MGRQGNAASPASPTVLISRPPASWMIWPVNVKYPDIVLSTRLGSLVSE